MTSNQYYSRANSARAQAGEILRQEQTERRFAAMAKASGRIADEKNHMANADALLREFHVLTKEANRLFLISKGELAEV